MSKQRAGINHRNKTNEELIAALVIANKDIAFQNEEKTKQTEEAMKQKNEPEKWN
jgi:hypothetical protein